MTAPADPTVGVLIGEYGGAVLSCARRTPIRQPDRSLPQDHFISRQPDRHGPVTPGDGLTEGTSRAYHFSLAELDSYYISEATL